MMREFEIERQFGIKIQSIKPNKGVYYLKTDKGDRCLKKINYGIQKLYFVYGAKEHLLKNGFANIDRYCLNTEGEPYALVNEDIYTLSQWIQGRECDFHNIDEVAKASTNLAKMHMASEGYEPPENSKLKTDLGRWPYLMEKRVKSFDRMRSIVRKKKSKKGDFDLAYIKNMEFYKEMGRRAMKVLEDSDYINLCAIAEEKRTFCHHDYTYHNIIIDGEDNYNIIDFDYCKRELRTYDIANFITKVLKRNEWNIDYAKEIIESYNSVNPLREEEYRVLFAFLLFPQRFWRLCNRYYYNEINWIQNTFTTKMTKLEGEKDNYVKFIEEFKKEFNQKE
ncbi:CotS family spore coat protein [Haloimpatiens lingqiaonensis]|uniref:CotS family spore coat protein n=1 Tax=Haloimpatiens lingqiaonensis TaxID=1380675 RepID=UPI0010FE49D2|nr:CotS family spore coat protein [Haloimpatiens lingqiaonensis]